MRFITIFLGVLFFIVLALTVFAFLGAFFDINIFKDLNFILGKQDFYSLLAALGGIGAAWGAFNAVKKALDMREKDRKEKIFQTERNLMNDLLDTFNNIILEHKKLKSERTFTLDVKFQNICNFYSKFFYCVSSLRIFIRKIKYKNRFISEYINNLVIGSDVGELFLYEKIDSILYTEREQILLDNNVFALVKGMENISQIIHYILELKSGDFLKVINSNLSEYAISKEITQKILGKNFPKEEFDFTMPENIANIPKKPKENEDKQ